MRSILIFAMLIPFLLGCTATNTSNEAGSNAGFGNQANIDSGNQSTGNSSSNSSGVVEMKNLVIEAPFQNGGYIQDKYTCSAQGTFPRIAITGIPQDAKFIALIIDDPDAPMGTFNHFNAWNIPAKPGVSVLDEGWGNSLKAGVFGKNTVGKTLYIPPCPPPGKPHRYYFKIFALSSSLALSPDATKTQLEAELAKAAIAKGEIMGLFKR